MASKRTAKVVSVTIVPNILPVKETVRTNLSPAKAQAVADKLNDSASLADLDPNRIVSYMVEK